jgi:hypothetical protein
MVPRVLWKHLLSIILFALALGNKYPQSGVKSKLYLVPGNHKKSQGKKKLDREAIHLRPTTELVTKIVGACLCSQISTPTYNQAAEIQAATRSIRNMISNTEHDAKPKIQPRFAPGPLQLKIYLNTCNSNTLQLPLFDNLIIIF